MASLALASCASTRPAKLPGGQHGLVVDCSGPSLSWTHCFQKAGQACPRGYDIAKRSEKGGGRIVSGDLFDLLGDKVQHRRLLIQCKDASGLPVTVMTPTVPAKSPPASDDRDDADDF